MVYEGLYDAMSLCRIEHFLYKLASKAIKRIKLFFLSSFSCHLKINLRQSLHSLIYYVTNNQIRGNNHKRLDKMVREGLEQNMEPKSFLIHT